MTLRTARRYDLDTDTVIFGNGVPFSRDSMKLGGLQEWVDSMFAFCRKMAILGVDNAEYSLITAICIFSGMGKFVNKVTLTNVSWVSTGKHET